MRLSLGGAGAWGGAHVLVIDRRHLYMISAKYVDRSLPVLLLNAMPWTRASPAWLIATLYRSIATSLSMHSLNQAYSYSIGARD